MPIQVSIPPKQFKNGHDPPQGPKEIFFCIFLRGPFLFPILS
jgi:hypothetical protein